MKLVIVTWRDITASLDWHTLNKLDAFITDQKENLVHQVGYLYEEDDDQLVLLDSYFADKSKYGTIHKIPRGCVVDIKTLMEVP